MSTYDAAKADLLNRLRRIEGQARGVARMADRDEDALAILTQLSAVSAAVKRAADLVRDEHVRQLLLSGADAEDVLEFVARHSRI